MDERILSKNLSSRPEGVLTYDERTRGKITNEGKIDFVDLTFVCAYAKMRRSDKTKSPALCRTPFILKIL